MTTNNVTNSAENLTRAEKRRLWKEYLRTEGYKKSGFLDFGGYAGTNVRSSKYMPHIGNKQKGL